MGRLFKRYKTRKTFTLDGMWKFKTDPDGVGKSMEWFKHLPNDSVDIIVPSCWNNELGLYEYEGLAWYSTKFITSSSNINLLFDGVTGQTEVYFDGSHIACHYGGFTGFNVTISDLPPGEHLLVLSVDNTHDNINTIPLSKVDWFHYGGIIRSVEVMELGIAWIKDFQINYELNESLKNATLSFRVNIEVFGLREFSGSLNIFIEDCKVYSSSFITSGSNYIQITGINFHNIKLWDIGMPNLYKVRFQIDGDDVIERIGFRQVCAEKGKILLNGREIFIKGVNRHEEHPDWGFAFPPKLMKKDIDIIKDLGCNAVRGSHYPNSELFIDYLDQEGLLFWEEIPIWQYFDEHFKNPVVVNRGLNMLDEMVSRDYHHPSIIIWSVHNEVDTTVHSGYDITRMFVDKVRTLDTSRLITYASNHPFEDICFPLVNIICINKYYGWYEGTLQNWDCFLEEFKTKLKNDGLEHVPFIMSEFGAAGIYGLSTFEEQKWSENYQEKLLEYTLKLFSGDSRISGTYLWQFADIRVCEEGILTRARGFNNKGIVNEYRKPKLAYRAVQKVYKSIL